MYNVSDCPHDEFSREISQEVVAALSGIDVNLRIDDAIASWMTSTNCAIRTDADLRTFLTDPQCRKLLIAAEAVAIAQFAIAKLNQRLEAKLQIAIATAIRACQRKLEWRNHEANAGRNGTSSALAIQNAGPSQ
jgi:hypothetical protein